MVFYKKKGFPNKGEIVLCKVKKILPHSAFVVLVEYENKEGMIHISEISNRWTKNIADVVNVGKQIVCRVEKVNTEKGYIDLSKKRVTSGEEKKKKNEVKTENRIEKLIQYAAKKNKTTLEDFYKKAGLDIIKEYETFGIFYENFKEDPSIVDDLNISNNLKKDIKTAFESLIQKSRVTVKKTLKFYANSGNGIEDIKNFIKKVLLGFGKEDVQIELTYINSPEYLLSINAVSYKEANIIIEKIIQNLNSLSKEFNITVLE